MKIIKSLIFILCSILLFVSCKKDDPPLSANQLNFESREQGLTAEANESEVKIFLSRTAETALPVSIDLIPSGLTYGVEFTTLPEASSNRIDLTIAAGASSGSFKVTKKAGVFFSGTESISFVIKGVPATAIAGDTDSSTVKFSAIVSTGSQLTLQGKTTASNYANVIYVDLSNNQSTPVDRKSWNLGFSNGAMFRVILNQSYQSTIKALAKTDINSVGLADTAGVFLNHDINDPATVSLVDYWDGDLAKTAVAEISSTESSNKVYLLSFEGNKNGDQYYKLRITRNGSGYKIQYAKVGETTIKELDVPKGADTNFQFVSLETNKTVQVEPKKQNWDIAWCYGTYNSGLGSPYWFQDLVLTNNIGGVKAAEVLETQFTYESFAELNIGSVTFSGTRDAIGSKWRQGAGPGGPGSIKHDRYYVVRDPQGNVYKLKFISWGGGGDAGERGKPVIEYKIVKKV